MIRYIVGNSTPYNHTFIAIKPREIVFTVYHPDLENEYEFFEYPHQNGKMSREYWDERGRGRTRVLAQLAGI